MCVCACLLNLPSYQISNYTRQYTGTTYMGTKGVVRMDWRLNRRFFGSNIPNKFRGKIRLFHDDLGITVLDCTGQPLGIPIWDQRKPQILQSVSGPKSIQRSSVVLIS